MIMLAASKTDCLVTIKGLEIGQMYINIGNITRIDQENVVNLLRNCTFYSLSMDGSSYIASIDQDILYMFCEAGRCDINVCEEKLAWIN